MSGGAEVLEQEEAVARGQHLGGAKAQAPQMRGDAGGF
jgi:hypothetical protein